MIQIKDVAYVRLKTQNLDTVSDFATRILGLQPVAARNNELNYRSDIRAHTLNYTLGDSE